MSFTTLETYIPTSSGAVSIGVFDGVHRGHQAVLRQTRQIADEENLTAIALTFDPHPMDLVAPARSPAYLCSLSQRATWLTEPGLASEVVVARFDNEFAALSAKQFVEDVLVGKLNAKRIRVGADFRFGKDRQGSVMDLESMGETNGFKIDIVHSVSRGGERISSTRIRSLVAEGDTETAAVLLGRSFTLRGTVVAGKGLGRTIGFPTANLQPEEARQLLPASGIYSGYAALPDGSHYRAAISVGTNPTTDGGSVVRKVEAYIMDGFDEDLYGSVLDIRFGAKIRDEQRFDSLELLVSQMHHDVELIAQITPPV